MTLQKSEQWLCRNLSKCKATYPDDDYCFNPKQSICLLWTNSLKLVVCVCFNSVDESTWTKLHFLTLQKRSNLYSDLNESLSPILSRFKLLCHRRLLQPVPNTDSSDTTGSARTIVVCWNLNQVIIALFDSHTAYNRSIKDELANDSTYEKFKLTTHWFSDTADLEWAIPHFSLICLQHNAEPRMLPIWIKILCPTNLHLCHKMHSLPTFSHFAQTPPFFAQTPQFFAQPSTCRLTMSW